MESTIKEINRVMWLRVTKARGKRPFTLGDIETLRRLWRWGEKEPTPWESVDRTFWVEEWWCGGSTVSVLQEKAWGQCMGPSEQAGRCEMSLCKEAELCLTWPDSLDYVSSAMGSHWRKWRTLTCVFTRSLVTGWKTGGTEGEDGNSNFKRLLP